jgi:hypothetical protein
MRELECAKCAKTMEEVCVYDSDQGWLCRSCCDLPQGIPGDPGGPVALPIEGHKRLLCD